MKCKKHDWREVNYFADWCMNCGCMKWKQIKGRAIYEYPKQLEKGIKEKYDGAIEACENLIKALKKMGGGGLG